MTLKNTVEKRLKTLSDFKKRLDKELEKMPDGMLSIRSVRNKFRYYLRSTMQEKTGIYLGLSKTDIIRMLENKNYYIQMIVAIEHDIKLLNEIKEKVEQIIEPENVFNTIEERKRHLIQPYSFAVDRIKAEQWEKEFMAQRKVSDIAGFFTKKGIKVRSKSELIIADRFEFYGVPYKYENGIFVGGEDVWFPDFTVMNKRNGKQYYWEHFGLMDNPDYCAGMQYKIEKYARDGIFDGQNLIISFESSKHTMNVKYVDLLIEEYLI